MDLEHLCVRTFGEVIRRKMNKKSRTKKFDSESKMFVTDNSDKGFDGTKDINFYPLLLNAVLYISESNGDSGLPDVSAKMISELKTGTSEVHPKIVEISQRKETLKTVSEYFAANIIPNITAPALAVVVDGIDTLVNGDMSLGKTLQKALAISRKNKTPADYLAEVWISAVTLGVNKTSDTNTPMDIVDVQTVLDEIRRERACVEQGLSNLHHLVAKYEHFFETAGHIDLAELHEVNKVAIKFEDELFSASAQFDPNNANLHEAVSLFLKSCKEITSICEQLKQSSQSVSGAMLPSIPAALIPGAMLLLTKPKPKSVLEQKYRDGANILRQIEELLKTKLFRLNQVEDDAIQEANQIPLNIK